MKKSSEKVSRFKGSFGSANEPYESNIHLSSLLPPALQLKAQKRPPNQVHSRKEEKKPANQNSAKDGSQKVPIVAYQFKKRTGNKSKNKTSKNGGNEQDQDLERFGTELSVYAEAFRRMDPPPMMVTQNKLLRKVAHLATSYDNSGTNAAVRNYIYWVWNSGTHSEIMEVLHSLQSQYPEQARIGLQAVDTITKVIVREKSRATSNAAPETFEPVLEIISPEEKQELEMLRDLVAGVVKAEPYMKGIIEGGIPGFSKIKQLDRLLGLPDALKKINEANTLGKKVTSYTKLISTATSAIEQFGSTAIKLNIYLVEDLIKKGNLNNAARATSQLKSLKKFGAKWSGAFKTLGGALSIVEEANNFWEALEKGDVMAGMQAGVGLVGSAATGLEGISLLAAGGETTAIGAVAGTIGTIAGGLGLYLFMVNEFGKVVGDMYDTIDYLKEKKVRNRLNRCVDNINDAVKIGNAILARERTMVYMAHKGENSEVETKLMIRLGEDNDSDREMIRYLIRKALDRILPEDLKYETPSLAKEVQDSQMSWKSDTESTLDLLQKTLELVSNVVGYAAHGYVGWEIRKVGRKSNQKKK